MYTTTITPPTSFIPPRVGGGTSEQDQWTGGTTLTRVNVKASLAATRPAKFSDRDKVARNHGDKGLTSHAASLSTSWRNSEWRTNDHIE